MALERVLEFVACIATVGEDVPQPGEPEADGFKDIGCAIAIPETSSGQALDVGRMDEDEDQKPAGVGEYVPLATLDLLARNYPAGPVRRVRESRVAVACKLK